MSTPSHTTSSNPRIMRVKMGTVSTAGPMVFRGQLNTGEPKSVLTLVSGRQGWSGISFMKRPFHLAAALLRISAGGLCAFGLTAADPSSVEFFENRIRPVLVERCYECHSAQSESLKGGLRLDFKAGWEKGGASGTPSVIPGNPDSSLLIQVVKGTAASGKETFRSFAE